jgi:YHS domain-containing protein
VHSQTFAREGCYLGESFHFCSDHCQEIFEHELEKYVQADLSSHQALQGSCAPEGVDACRFASTLGYLSACVSEAASLERGSVPGRCI